jgi:hypothetical protein
VDIGKENVDGDLGLVFGIYQRNGKVITYDRKHDTLIPLIYRNRPDKIQILFY